MRSCVHILDAICAPVGGYLAAGESLGNDVGGAFGGGPEVMLHAILSRPDDRDDACALS